MNKKRKQNNFTIVIRRSGAKHATKSTSNANQNIQ